MTVITDSDRFFVGRQNSSSPKYLLDEGVVSRLVNGRFIEGAITNSLNCEEFKPRYAFGPDKRPFAATLTYDEILNEGDVQLTTPIENIAGKFLVQVISGVLFLIDVKTYLAYDITPTDSLLPESSAENILTYIHNSGSVYGVGGYLCIFNYPNRPIFVNQNGARLSDPFNNEVPASRLGASAGNRVFVISGDNILLSSDPFGGAYDLAPLTFNQIFNPSTGFTGQTHIIGSSLDTSRVTALARIPKFLGPNEGFLAKNLLASTEKHKYIIAAGEQRDQWQNVQFITYAGSSDGIAGPNAWDNIGDNIIYISSTGRIKSIAQDQTRDSGMTESFWDEELGQYLCKYESSLYYRDWYSTLNHSRSIVRFDRERLFVTVYPMKAPAVGKYGQKQYTWTHRALAVASLDPLTQIGSEVKPVWEGFYDSINPCGMVTIDDILYVVSKDLSGKIRYFRINKLRSGNAVTTIYTRGYFSKYDSSSKSVLRGSLYFRRLVGSPKVRVSYLADEEWIEGEYTEVKKNRHVFKIDGSKRNLDSASIPLKIDIEHRGCVFELESIRVQGEAHADSIKGV